MNINDLNSIKDTLASDFDDFWNYNILNEELNSENSIYIIAKSENQVVGFAGIKIILDEAEIMNIVVRKDFRGYGLGTLLLKKLIEICKNKNISSIFLEVNDTNLIAKNLYKKFGFAKIYTRKKYYDNKFDGIVMKKII